MNIISKNPLKGRKIGFARSEIIDVEIIDSSVKRLPIKPSIVHILSKDPIRKGG